MPYYKEDFHNYDPTKELYEFLGFLVLVLFLLWAVTSCTTTKTLSDIQIQKDSIVSVSKQSHDTTSIHTVYKDRFVDHYVNNTYVLNPLGDTLRTNTIERIYESVNTKQSDSIRILQATVDSLQQIGKQKEIKIVEKQLTKWEKTKIDTYEYIFISLLACMALIIWYFFYRLKKIV